MIEYCSKNQTIFLFKGIIQLYFLTLMFVFIDISVFFMFLPEDWFSSSNLISLLFSVLFSVFYAQVIKQFACVMGKVKGLVFTVVNIAFYCLLVVVLINQGGVIDVSLLFSNIGLLAYKESWDPVLAAVDFEMLLKFLILGSAAVVLEVRFRLATNQLKQERVSNKNLLISLVSAFVVLLFPMSNCNTLVTFIRSSYAYFSPDVEDYASDESGNGQYPFYKENELSGLFGNEEVKPNIFILMMESYNGLFTDKKAPNGKYVTPYFNELKKEGLYVDRFYGNSVQTAKGQFATLTGVLPSYNHKIFTTREGLSVKALPQILNKNGYHSIFMKSFEKIDFDNTGFYMKKLGFNDVVSIGKLYREEIPESARWGWGMQDDYFYRKCFRHLDYLDKQASKKPVFAVLHTLSHHMSFRSMPKEQRYLLPNGNSNYENFLNSMHLADHYLKTFIIELKKRGLYRNSIIVVTGDHSHMHGEHGKWFGQPLYHEEYFRTPFLLIHKKKVKPTKYDTEIFFSS